MTDNDTRVVYGVTCTYWGDITTVAVRNGLPVCPSCRRPLYEMENEAVMLLGAAEFDKTHPGYLDMVKWAKNRKPCWKSMEQLEAEYRRLHIH